MKKKVVFLLIIFLFPGVVFASGREEVSLSKCVDGDTAKFIINNKEETVRFLAVDTPETKHPTKGEEPYGKEASDYTCNRLKEGNKIELEYDDNSTKTDKYKRYLAWVFVDDNLLQAELVKNGLAEVAYLYGDYKYTDLLKDYEQTAIATKVGMHSDTDTSSYTKDKEVSSKKKSKKQEKSTENDKEKIKNSILDYISSLLDEILDEIFK